MATKKRIKCISGGAQRRQMQALFPKFAYSGKGNLLKWIGQVCPTDSSAVYLAEINYLVGVSRPKVLIKEPDLILSNPLSDTHRFWDGSLCLHTHAQWSADQMIADLIVPWIPLWLFYYEGWVVTGDWKGGGEHPVLSVSNS
jgi:hypothetical protein